MKKKLLILLFTFIALSCLGQNVYFVATDGNNSNPGTKAQPFLTIQHGINQLSAGDTLYIRGGVYYITTTLAVNSLHPDNHSNGTEENPIVVSAYPPDHAVGNVPIIDGINAHSVNNVWIRDISWWKFWGITSRHALQNGSPTVYHGWHVSRANSIYFEQCVAHNNAGNGFGANQGSLAYFINCDSYNNVDTLFTPPNQSGGRGHGFGAGGIGTTAYFIGCRAWDNSDNSYGAGLDPLKIVFDNCWSIRPGKLDGDGRGWAIGLQFDSPPPSDQFLVKNSISAYARSFGFNVNSRLRPYQINAAFYNNIDIKSDASWVIRESANEAGSELIFRNNVSLGQAKKITNQTMAGWLTNTEFAHDYISPDRYNIAFTADFNSWDFPSMFLSEDDFIGPIDSLSIVTAMLAPRKPDGSLPDLFNLFPTESSNLRNAGIDVGLPYNGSAPDLGPFQYDPNLSGHTIIFQIQNENGNAINNATITFGTITNPLGNYNFNGIAQGSYNYSISAPDYQTISVNNYQVDNDVTIPVTMTLNNYQVNLSASPSAGGNVTGQGSYQHGQTASISATANTGYSFVNWTENGNIVSTLANYSFPVTGNRNLVANFNSVSYNITLSAYPIEGGTVSGGGNIQHGQTANIAATANEGYVFVNWTENGNVVSTQANYSFSVTGNQNLVANFNTVSYNITLSANPVEGGTVSGGGNIQHGQTANIVALPNEGYQFVNWTENGTVVSNQPNYSFTVNSSRNLVANFSNQILTLDLSASPINAGTLAGAGNYVHGQTANALATPAEGYNFVNWSENGTLVSELPLYTFTMTSNRTLVANFTISIHSVQAGALPAEGGMVAGGGNYDYGQTANLSAMPNQGYSFVNWTENGSVVSNQPNISFTVTQDRNLMANFALNTHQITLNANPSNGGSVFGDGTFYFGQAVTVNAISNTGYTFENWTENGTIVSSVSNYSFEINADRQLTANFITNTYAVYIISNPAEGGQIFGEGNYTYGEFAYIEAVASSGYVFEYWTVNEIIVSEDPSYSFQVNESITIVGHFSTEEEYDNVFINAAASPEGFGWALGSGVYGMNETVILQAQPMDDSFRFTGWFVDDVLISEDYHFSFVAVNSMNVYARFEHTTRKFEVQIQAREVDHSDLDSESLWIIGTGLYEEGEMAILEFAAAENIRFIGWRNLAGQIVSRRNPYMFEVHRDTELELLVKVFEEEISNIKVFPNPSDGRFYVNISENTAITVYNSQGIALETIFVTPENNQLNLAYLPTGVYFLRFQAETNVTSAKIIIR